MKKLEQFIAAISIFASGLIFGYYAEKPIETTQIQKQARTYIVGDCEVKVDKNNVLLDIECKEVRITKSSIGL